MCLFVFAQDSVIPSSSSMLTTEKQKQVSLEYKKREMLLIKNYKLGSNHKEGTFLGKAN